MHRSSSVLLVLAVAVAGNSTRLYAQSIPPADAPRSLDSVGVTRPAWVSEGSGSHRVRIGGIVGGAIGFAGGVVGGGMLGFGDNDSQLRGITYLAASGAVAGWIAGTVVTLPFHGHSEIGSNDVRNATITGGTVGLATGLAAGTLAGFKCTRNCSGIQSVPIIAVMGLVGTGIGAVIGHGVGTSMPH